MMFVICSINYVVYKLSYFEQITAPRRYVSEQRIELYCI